MIPLLCIAVLTLFPQDSHETRDVQGWQLQIDRRLLKDKPQATEEAVKLLTAQLKEIERVVPPASVTELKKVTLWFSPPYPGTQAKAEYHPSAGWLRENGRNVAMAKNIEFTNIDIFAAETRRMPNFALHELSHAYHDRVLSQGYGNSDVADAYKRAKAGGKYDRVLRQDSEGRKTHDRAYAMVNPQEYFAETTEAYFTSNDFFPFNRAELEVHDPTAVEMLKKLWR